MQNKAIKYVLVSMGSILAMSIIIFLLLTFFFNPNHFKNTLSKQVTQMTGREFVINGNMRWTLFPWLAIQINDARLNNAAEFGNDPFAQIQEANISLKLFPLLHGNIEIGKIALKDSKINLIKNKDGKTNWQNLLNTTEESTAQPNANTTVIQSDKHFFKTSAFSISDIDITNAHINWINLEKNQHYKISDLNIQAQTISFNKPFQLSIKGSLKTKETMDPTMFQVSSMMSMDPASHNYKFTNTKLTLEVTDKKYSLGKLLISLHADIAANTLQNMLILDNLALDLADLHATGSLQGTSVDNSFVLRGKLQTTPFNPKKIMQALGKTHSIKGNVLENAALATNIQLTSQDIQLSQLRLVFDDCTLLGTIKYSSINDKTILNYNLALDHIDVNKYLPAFNDKTSASSVPEKLSVNLNSSNKNQSHSTPANFIAQGRLQIGKLQMPKITATDVVVDLDTDNGLIKLNPVTAQFYQGHYAGSWTFDTRTSATLITMKHAIVNMQAEPLLQSLTTSSRTSFTGIINANAQFNTQGHSADDYKRNLSGLLTFNLSNGVLKGVDVEHYVSQGLALAKKDSSLLKPNSGKTNFGNFNGSFKLTNGIAQTNDLLLRSDHLQATGKGNINLPQRTIDLGLNTTLLNPTTHQPQGFVIPLRVKGSLEKPSIQPDMEAILRAQAQQQVEHLKDKAGEEINKRVGKDVGEAIKKLNLDSLFR